MEDEHSDDEEPIVTTAATPSDQLADEARRGQEAFDRFVKPQLRADDDGKFVAVDIQSGNYEIDADDYQATGRLMARLPGARIWLLRAGHPTTYRIVRQNALSFWRAENVSDRSLRPLEISGR